MLVAKHGARKSLFEPRIHRAIVRESAAALNLQEPSGLPGQLCRVRSKKRDAKLLGVSTRICTRGGQIKTYCFHAAVETCDPAICSHEHVVFTGAAEKEAVGCITVRVPHFDGNSGEIVA
jgi:hypothetical protein